MLRLCRNCTNVESFPTFFLSSKEITFHHHHFRCNCNKQTESWKCLKGLAVLWSYISIMFTVGHAFQGKTKQDTGNSPATAGPCRRHQRSPFFLLGSCHWRYRCFNQLGQGPGPAWQLLLKMLFPLSLPSCCPFLEAFFRT